MSLWTLLLIVVIVMLIGGLPHWPHATVWGGGWGPSSVAGVILVVLLVMLVMGKL